MNQEQNEIRDEELLRLAGRACAEEEAEQLFPADEAWKEFQQKRRRGNRQFYAVCSAAAILLGVLIGYNWYTSAKQEPKEIELFTAAAPEDSVILCNGEAVPDTTLDLTAVGSSAQVHYTVEVPAGKHLQLILPDSSRVHLNAQSRLYYEQTDTRAAMLEGEGYFQVHRDTLRPFVVSVGEVQAEVLGTSFNIRGYAQEGLHITLLSGSLALKNEKQMQLFLMKPGEDAALQPDGDFQIREVRQPEQPQWTTGYFDYDRIPLADLMREVGRCYNLSIVSLDPHVTDRKIHFRCRRMPNVDHVLEILNELGGFHLERNGNTIFIR